MSEEIAAFANKVDVEGIKFIKKIDSDDIEFDMLTADEEGHGCGGVGQGSVTTSFLKLGGVFEYSSWPAIIGFRGGVHFEASKNDKELVIKFYEVVHVGSTTRKAYVGKYTKADVNQKVDVKGTCSFDAETDANARKQKLSLD